VVTNVKGNPEAVLIRGIIPADGVEIMLNRTGKDNLTPKTGIGPGNVARLLGIHYSHSGFDLVKPGRTDDAIWIEDRGQNIDPWQMKITTRIGVDYAGKDALLPYRFVADPSWISTPPSCNSV
jgi:DNA-3-methyladenine glycosylase